MRKFNENSILFFLTFFSQHYDNNIEEIVGGVAVTARIE